MENKLLNLKNFVNLSELYNKIKNKLFKRTKRPIKKSKVKYKLNFLNKAYSYSSAYLAKHIYIHICKLKHLNKYIIQKNSKINTIILHYKKLFIKKKDKKSMKYSIIMGTGSNNSWVGIGVGKNSSYKATCLSASYKSKKNIYNLKFVGNDYKMFKYKNYKFSMINKAPNSYNLNIYDNLTFLTGLKKLKLISHTRSSTKTILKSLLYYFS